jgi:hypothetical protein
MIGLYEPILALLWLVFGYRAFFYLALTPTLYEINKVGTLEAAWLAIVIWFLFEFIGFFQLLLFIALIVSFFFRDMIMSTCTFAFNDACSTVSQKVSGMTIHPSVDKVISGVKSMGQSVGQHISGNERLQQSVFCRQWWSDTVVPKILKVRDLIVQLNEHIESFTDKLAEKSAALAKIAVFIRAQKLQIWSIIVKMRVQTAKLIKKLKGLKENFGMIQMGMSMMGGAGGLEQLMGAGGLDQIMSMMTDNGNGKTNDKSVDAMAAVLDDPELVETEGDEGNNESSQLIESETDIIADNQPLEMETSKLVKIKSGKVKKAKTAPLPIDHATAANMGALVAEMMSKNGTQLPQMSRAGMRQNGKNIQAMLKKTGINMDDATVASILGGFKKKK